MILPPNRDIYERNTAEERDRVLIAEDARNFKKRQDVFLATERLILRAPNGSKWQITVSNAGALATVSIP